MASVKDFTYKHTVHLHETNAMGGVVYFANFVKWQGIAREEFFMKAFLNSLPLLALSLMATSFAIL